MKQYFSIIADVEQSKFTIFHAVTIGMVRSGDVLAVYYHDVNGESKEDILLEYEIHLKGSLKELCLIYKWTTDLKTTPRYPIEELEFFAGRHKRNNAIDNILIL